MFTQQAKIKYLHFKQYPDSKISLTKELTPKAAKRHKTQKMTETVKTAMAFIAHCPAIQQHRAGKNNGIFGTKTRGKRQTGNWEVVRGKGED